MRKSTHFGGSKVPKMEKIDKMGPRDFRKFSVLVQIWPVKLTVSPLYALKNTEKMGCARKLQILHSGFSENRGFCSIPFLTLFAKCVKCMCTCVKQCIIKNAKKCKKKCKKNGNFFSFSSMERLGGVGGHSVFLLFFKTIITVSSLGGPQKIDFFSFFHFFRNAPNFA